MPYGGVWQAQAVFPLLRYFSACARRLVKREKATLMTAVSKDITDDDYNIFYTMYKDLPIGAALVNNGMTVISSNKQMCRYFPCSGAGIDGFPLCKALKCSSNHPSCGRCQLKSAVECIVTESIRTEIFEMQLGTERWFRINGIPVNYAGKNYAALFFYDITEHMHKEETMRKQLSIDIPTKALNKSAIMEYLDAALYSKYRTPFTMCMVDFDNFKIINDTCGHLAGDNVLSAFSDIVRKNIRQGDIFGRFGGEEFIFVFTDTKLSYAVEIIKRIQKELLESFAGELPMPVTFSAGAVYASDSSCLSKEKLISTADRLMYTAKKKGKNKIETGCAAPD